MPDALFCNVLALALRTEHLGPMKQVDAMTVRVGGSAEGDHGSSAKRGVTFLSDAQWREVNAELDSDLPWHTRRANVLCEIDRLGVLIGKTLRVGDVVVRILAETAPCAEMDYFHPGLRKALIPDCRGGVYGQVMQGGTIRVGDGLTVVA